MRAMGEAMAETKYCDIIMRGGITSGVVYPGAVVELVDRGYTFKNVGGASAGAIAAAMTAAAQHAATAGIKTGDVGAKFQPGFAGIAAMPKWFGAVTGGASGASNLLKLFQPQQSTSRLFTILMWVLRSGRETTGDDGRGKYEKATERRATLRAALGVAAAFPWIAVPVLLFGAAVAAAAFCGAALAAFAALAWLCGEAVAERWAWFGWLLGTISGLGALAAALLTAAVAFGMSAFVYANRSLPKNFFGICSGGSEHRDRRYATDNPPPLGHWMSETINELAGRRARDSKPLTFGDLWGPDKDIRNADLRLHVMTTDLSRSRPYRLPFDDDEPPFYFAETEFRRLFPAEVVNWMVERSRERLAAAEKDRFGTAVVLYGDVKYRGHLTLLPLPRACDLPVVAATRMSMSFPLLLAAVPLYTIEHSKQGGVHALRHWFSDGGMCSNFPIHLFDSPLPRWPTFGINLRYFDEKRTPAHLPAAPRLPGRSYLPNSDADDAFSFNFPIGERGIGSFVSAIKSAMQNWLDFAQMDYPGFRDRIAQVYLDGKEGGMNLNMPQSVIQKLSSRGKTAAGLLATQFNPVNASPAPAASTAAAGGPVPYSWDNHRRVRFKTFMRLSEEAFRAYQRNHVSRNYGALLAGDPTALAWSAEYLALASKYEAAAAAPGSVFDNMNAPSPYAIFRIMPDV